jgi:hypothetical protein
MPTIILTPDDVIQIYNLAHGGQYTHQEIADMWGIAKSNVSHIKSGRNWGALTSKEKEHERGSRE